MNLKKNRVCVIGAGTAGLSALKNALEHGMEALAYEQCKEVGGTWVYHESVNVECEEDMHSSMYEGLRTNLPKEVMGYPDFKYSDNIEESFVPSAEVLNFLKSYAEHFKLMPFIKLQHEIIRVRPWKGFWEVYVHNIKTDTYNVELFDYVFVCNGHYTVPLYPEVDGLDVYRGRKLHSHLYRKASAFKDTTVLIIGAGPSGMDIANHIRKCAKHVFLSHHLQPPPDTEFMGNVTHKPDVKQFTETGAIFKDGSTENFSSIVFCTGYKYTFPFLSSDVGLRIDDNYVYPLYKHCININYPTMAVIGLPFYVCPSQLFDLQIRFALKFFSKQKELPNKEEMRLDMEQEMRSRWASGLSKRQAHSMGDRQCEYYNDLALTADIANIKPVIGKIMEDCGRKYIYELKDYRDNCFKVLDDNNFIKFPSNKS